MALTAKQEAFCQNIIEGCTQTEAYRRSYECSNMDDKTVNNEGYKLMNNRGIAARIKQLRDQLAEMMLYPRIKRLERLAAIAEGAERDGDSISAIKAFNDMVGDGVPIKMQVEHSGETTQKTINIVRAEDIEQDD